MLLLFVFSSQFPINMPMDLENLERLHQWLFGNRSFITI